MNPYSYNNGEFPFNLNLKQTKAKWSCYRVDFPSAHPTCYEENNTVRGEYYQPQGIDNAPLVILVHGMGGYGAFPCHLLARTLVKKGFACFVLYQVFHPSRLPEDIKNRLYDLTPEEWFESYRISVIDVRQVVDWASNMAEINQEQVAAFGISFGGLISAIAMGIDERIKAGVFMVSGGNSPKMMWKSRRRYTKGYRYSEAEYNQMHSQYMQYLAEVAEKGFENVTPPRKGFLNDPLTFAPYLRQRPLLMLNARWDEAVPREATIDFWEACGKPPITWFPATHASIWLWYPLISRKIVCFLSDTFRTPVERLT